MIELSRSIGNRWLPAGDCQALSHRNFFLPANFESESADPSFSHPPPARRRVHISLFSEFRADLFCPVNLGNPTVNLKNFAPPIFDFLEGA